MTTEFDPEAPLAPAPTPWAATDTPTPRDGPPYHMTEMIEAEPALAVRVLERLERDGSAAALAEVVGATSDACRPIVVVGCGTSEHGAQAVAAQLRAALSLRRFDPRPEGVIPPGEDVPASVALDPALGPTLAEGEPGSAVSVQAFEASLVQPVARGGLVIGVTHEGGSWATIEAMEAGDLWGAEVAVITAAAGSTAAKAARLVLDTGEIDQSWCHTVGYVSPIVAGLAVELALVAALGAPRAVEDQSPGALVAAEVRSLLADGLEPTTVESIDALAAGLADCNRLIIVASGVDEIAARELALKVEEGVQIPATARNVETLLHGHLAGMDAQTGVVAIAADDSQHEDRARRLSHALRAVREIGCPAGAIVDDSDDRRYDELLAPELTPAGRVVVTRQTNYLVGPSRALLATAIPLQLLTERLARQRGVNPDPIRRDDPRYLRAADVASAWQDR
jgi:glucosamine 6-phosphate synthetase-like amidotransferase/phosphosugar isomerase protein